MIKLLRSLEAWPRTLLTTFVILLVFHVALADAILLGFGISSSIAYLLPVALAGWSLGRAATIAFSLLCVVASVSVGYLVSTDLTPASIFWSAVVSFGFFSLVGLVLAEERSVGRLREEEQKLLRMDSLTSLPNGQGFFDVGEPSLRRVLRSAQPAAVLFANVDDLRGFNDYFGRAAGDAILVSIGAGIQQLLRPGDLAARLGGDEFAVLLAGVEADEACRFTRTVQEMFRDLEAAHGRAVRASIGMVVSKDPCKDLRTLLIRAEQLMYAAKDSGKNGVRWELPLSIQAPTSWFAPRENPGFAVNRAGNYA